MSERLAFALTDRYRIERELGQGGMATVYLAQDLKHDRKVALKVLKPELSAVLGADRFVVEIRTTASLQHPHILPLFDSGTADGFLFYVMPYIEGETLRARLNRETQLGIEEAVRITTEVADALDYAHRHGVIHRDIKPENILLHDGRPMVADFGIALAVSAAAGGRMTETGLSLGTPHYMSPEQATAEKEITARSDIYSLASVLYEMLAGQPPHIGGSAQQIIMKIITEPASPVTTVRKSVPPNVAAALARALEKLPADRFDSAKAFAAALHEERFTHGTAVSAVRAAGSTGSVNALTWALATGALLALIGVASAVWAWRLVDDAPQASVELTLDVPTANPDLSRFAVSPDGALFAFATAEGIAVRDAGQREYRILAGTSDPAASPSFSPDGAWIAYHGGSGLLRRIAVTGGSALALIPGDTLRAQAVHWGADGSIVFKSGRGLYRIPRDGGSAELLDDTESAQSPRLLPDGSGVLYVDTRTGSKLMYHDFATGSVTTALEESSEGQYVETGHIVYAHPTGGLFAVRFDLRRRAAEGAPVPLVTDLRPDGTVAPFQITRSGMLVYRAGVDPESRLLMLDRRGRLDTLPLTPRVMSYARFSPDGRSLALTIGSARGTNRHTAIHDMALGSLTRFTLEGGGHSPVWSPDGRTIVFTAEGPETVAEDLFAQPVDRSASPRQIARIPEDQHATAWPVDSILAFSTFSGTLSGGDVFLVNPTTSGAHARPYLAAQWAESDVVVSPDGRHAAYVSNQSGALEVYVRAFPVPEAGGQFKISEGGGLRPRWAPNGRAVLYQSLDGSAIRSVRVDPGPPFRVVAREQVLSAPRLGSAWDVDHATGRIVVAQAVVSNTAQMVVVLNWQDRLRRARAP